MLKTISPLISPTLLKALAEMGHGDEIIFSDAHFPAQSLARRSFAPMVLASAIYCEQLFRSLSWIATPRRW